MLIQYVMGNVTIEEAHIIELGVRPEMLTATTLAMIWNDMLRADSSVRDPMTFQVRTPHA